MLMRAAPALFVLLWSTGFIGSRLGAADAEPFTFLSIRFLLVIVLLLPVAFSTGGGKGTNSWPAFGHAAAIGALIHGLYLGGVFWAIHRGMPAGVAALVVSLQPILTAILAGPLLGERVTRQHWLGLALGLAGAALIILPKIETTPDAASGINVETIAATLIALVGITTGTLYQKRTSANLGLMRGAVWQYTGALLIVGIGSLLTETGEVAWTPKFIFALGWLVIVLSIGAISLLMLLIRQNAVSTVSSLFFLVPGVTAVMAYLMFGETLSPVQLTGLVLAGLAVLLTSFQKGNFSR